MKATKFTVRIDVEVLSLDAVSALVFQAVEQFQKEFTEGELTATDGDTVSWSVSKDDVTF